jgi:general secretion pathway protein G
MIVVLAWQSFGLAIAFFRNPGLSSRTDHNDNRIPEVSIVTLRPAVFQNIRSETVKLACAAANFCRRCAPAMRQRKKTAVGPTPRDAGFTLLELMVVTGIIAMLASVAYPFYLDQLLKARIQATKGQIRQISVALELYALDVGSFPPQQVGLTGLLQQPTNTPAWQGPYLKTVGLMDPWGRPFNYKFPGTNGQPEVYTVAFDKVPAISGN